MQLHACIEFSGRRFLRQSHCLFEAVELTLFDQFVGLAVFFATPLDQGTGFGLRFGLWFFGVCFFRFRLALFLGELLIGFFLRFGAALTCLSGIVAFGGLACL